MHGCKEAANCTILLYAYVHALMLYRSIRAIAIDNAKEFENVKSCKFFPSFAFLRVRYIMLCLLLAACYNIPERESERGHFFKTSTAKNYSSPKLF